MIAADDPRHGTTAGYSAHQSSHQSPCDACKAAKNAYEHSRKRQKAYGRWSPWVEAEPVREHIRELMAEGTSLKQIARNAGFPLCRVGYVLYGRGTKNPPTQVRPDFAAAIMSVEYSPARVPIVGTQRRLAALMALGYDQRWLSNQLGITQGAVWRHLHGYHGVVYVSTAERVDAIYRAYSMVLPQPETRGQKYAVSRARNTATRNAWLPPLAWANIDDPDESPDVRHVRPLKTDIDPVVVQRVLGGDRLPTTHAEKVEITRRWEEQGRSLNDLERLMGWRSDRYTQREAS